MQRSDSHCLVVYESMYGNTHEVADAIGAGLAHLGQVRVTSVVEVGPDDLKETDLLVVGGPTHVHGMARPTTRRAAAEEAANDETIDLEPEAVGPGLREWLAALDKSNEVSCAVFDTRIDKPVILVGSAAKGISKRLKRLGYSQIVEPESFFVDDSSGPLHSGERDRARQWGVAVAHELTRLNRHKMAKHEDVERVAES